jgi:hypothetical protein
MRSLAGRDRFFSRLVAVAIFALATGTASRAGAASTGSIRDAIAVDPGATCLDASTLAEQVQSWLGSDPLATDVSIRVHGSPDQPRVVRFEALRAGHVIATRAFNPGPASCEHLHAAVGLAIALAVNASLVGEISALVGTPPGATVAAHGPLPSWEAGLSAVAAANVLTGVAFGIDAVLERSFSSGFALRLGVFGIAALPATFDGLPGHYDQEVVAAHLDVCAGMDPAERIRLQGCLGFAGGMLIASGYGFTVPRTTVGVWTAIENSLQVLGALNSRWSIVFAPGLTIPLQRTSIVVRDRSGAQVSFHDLASVGEFIGLGANCRL